MDEVRKKLLESRLGRLALRQQGASDEKMKAELDKLVRRFEASGLNASHFTSLIAALAKKHVRERWERRQAREEVRNAARRQAEAERRALERERRRQELLHEAELRQGGTPTVLTPRSEGEEEEDEEEEPMTSALEMAPGAAASARAVNEEPDDDDDPFVVTVEALLTEAARRVQRAWRALRDRRHLYAHVSAAKMIASRWRRRKSDKLWYGDVDAVIEESVVRLQQSYFAHRDQRQSQAALRSLELGHARPVAPATKAGPRKLRRAKVAPASEEELVPQPVQVPLPPEQQPIRVTLIWNLPYAPSERSRTPTPSSLVVAAPPAGPWEFDPQNWFAERPMSAGSIALSMASSPAGSSKGSSRGGEGGGRDVVTLPGALAPVTVNGFEAFVEPPEQQAGDAVLEQLTLPKGGGAKQNEYQLISRSRASSEAASRLGSRASTSAASRASAASCASAASSLLKHRLGVLAPASEPPLQSSKSRLMEVAKEMRLRRVQIFKQQHGQRSLAARAHVLAHRAAWAAQWRGPLTLDGPAPLTPVAVSAELEGGSKASGHEDAHALMHESFLNLSAIEYVFSKWRHAEAQPGDDPLPDDDSEKASGPNATEDESYGLGQVPLGMLDVGSRDSSGARASSRGSSRGSGLSNGSLYSAGSFELDLSRTSTRQSHSRAFEGACDAAAPVRAFPACEPELLSSTDHSSEGNQPRSRGTAHPQESLQAGDKAGADSARSSSGSSFDDRPANICRRQCTDELSPFSAKARRAANHGLFSPNSNRAQADRPDSSFGVNRRSVTLAARPDTAHGCGDIKAWRDANAEMEKLHRRTPPIVSKTQMREAAAGGQEPAHASSVLHGLRRVIASCARRLARAALCRACSAMCRSVVFWRIFPWTCALALIVLCHIQVLFVATRIFSEYPNPAEIGAVWVQAIFLSFAIGWFIQDPIVITIRNNLNVTRTIIRSHKYQVLEKWVIVPFRAVVTKAVDLVLTKVARIFS